MTLAFSKIGAPNNVLVNAIRVGTTDTKLHKNNPDKEMTSIINSIPMKRMANASEIAESIYFLASRKVLT